MLDSVGSYNPPTMHPAVKILYKIKCININISRGGTFYFNLRLRLSPNCVGAFIYICIYNIYINVLVKYLKLIISDFSKFLYLVKTKTKTRFLYLVSRLYITQPS